MATLRIRHPDGEEQEQVLVRELTVGRAEGNGLVLASGGVSRRHARFYVEAGRVMVEDSGSANGTYVDGERIAGPTPVGPGTEVQIGEYSFSIKPEAPPRRRTSAGGDVPALAPRPSREVAPADPTAPVLRGLTGPWLNKRYPVRDKVVVGRVPGNDVHLDDESVSRRHAEVFRRGDEVWVRDLESANGTLLNGEPVQESPVQLGDVLQFGVIELTLEPPDAERMPRRVSRSGPPARRMTGELPVEASEPRSRRRELVIVIGAIVAGLAVVGLAVSVWLPTEAPTPEPLAGGPPKAPGTSALAGNLSECRSFSPEHAMDWDKAEAACNRVLDAEPIHREAQELLRKIRAERVCSEHFEKGEAARYQRPEEAIEHYARIDPACSFYLKAQPVVWKLLEPVLKEVGNDCRRYARGHKWQSALKRCEAYLRFACPNMDPQELEAIAEGAALHCEGSRPADRCPRDPLARTFLTARRKVDPGAPPWTCPGWSIVRREKVADGVGDKVRHALHKRFGDKQLADGMFELFSGNPRGAMLTLQRIGERQDKDGLQGKAKELWDQISEMTNLVKQGQNALKLNPPDPEKAAKPMDRALDIDRQIFGEDPQLASTFRLSIQKEMADGAYSKGKQIADQKDHRRACHVWKLGFRYYRGDDRLNNALTKVCTAKAGELLPQATTCEQLSTVLEYAVEGDGFEEKARKKMGEQGCQ